MTATVLVRIIKSDFQRGLRYAKRWDGVYDPAAKTWAIAADRPELGNLKAYGLERVSPVSNDVGYDHITDDFILDTGDPSMDSEDSIL